MSDLIKALEIFLMYEDPHYPTHCEHDQLTINISPSIVAQEDKEKLKDLGFHASDDYFISYRFGSC